MDSVEDYARKWEKQEEVELDKLSNWVSSIRSLIRKRTYNLSRSMSFKVRSIFNEKSAVELTKPPIISSLRTKHKILTVL